MNQTQRLVDHFLEQSASTSLADFLALQRSESQSYERIARNLYEQSNGLVDVTWQTIKRWCEDFDVAEKVS